MLGLTLDFLRPQYTWSALSRQPKSPPSSIPPVPRLTPWILRRFWGYIHKFLIKFSVRYCAWNGIRSGVGFFAGAIHPLPFGLLLKWSDGTRLEEVLATQVLRAAGLPVPKIICYGEHPQPTHATASILMTRVPGETLFEDLWDWFEPEQRATIVSELKAYVGAIRCWENPWNGGGGICSILGTNLRSFKVPMHRIGPCENEEEFNKSLMEPACHPDVRKSRFYKYNSELEKTKLLLEAPHKVVFTHGDLLPHQILVTYDGHVSAILDWETAGWYPEYWEYSLAWRRFEPGSWWFEIVRELSEGKYLREWEGHLAVQRLTASSMPG